MRTERLMTSPHLFLSDGGLETYMIFEKGFELPSFSAAALLDTSEGRQALRDYYEHFIGIARASSLGFVLDAPTWRAGLAWASALGQTQDEALDTNARAVAFVQELQRHHEDATLPIVVNGLVGPAGDAYAPDTQLDAKEAQDIHQPQVEALARAKVDLISAMTLTYVDEAVGIARAASMIDVPVVIAFTLETDGRLPSGQSLGDAIAEVDDRTAAAPLYFMINCAHPDHFQGILKAPSSWTERIGGVRCNASRLSHAELDEAETLDSGDPVELGHLTRDVISYLPNVRVVGGCCGTDHRHVGCMAQTCPG